VIALVLALQTLPPPPAPLPVGRIYTSATLHVGVRPSVYVDLWETALGVTVQVSWLHLL
jgi:hypothetical protein